MLTTTLLLPVLLLRLNGAFARRNGAIFLDMQFANEGSAAPLSQFAIQFNKNTFALAPLQQGIALSPAVQTGSSADFSVPIAINPSFAKRGAAPSLVASAAAAADVCVSRIVSLTRFLPTRVRLRRSRPR